MNFVNSLSAWQWAIMAIVPPAVLMLYFLKLKRQALEVPSTYLWRRTVEDMHVNSLWQKLRSNLLLLLQLLFLTALIFACLRPGVHGDLKSGRRWIFLIDNSASMSATDVDKSRLDEAKKKLKSSIDLMNVGDVAMVIAFSDRADVRQGFTGDKRRLAAAADAIEQTSRTTDVGEAMRAAAGLANPGRSSFDGMNDIQVAEALPATVFLYSDGGFPSLGEFDLGNLTVEYVAIGNRTIDNVGIEAFSISRNEENPDQLEVYGRVANYSDSAVTVPLTLTLNDKLIDAAEKTIDAGKDTGVDFDLEAGGDETGIFKLVIDRPDQLITDNQAFASVRPTRPIQVLVVSPGNRSLEKSLTTAAIQSIAQVKFESPAFLLSSSTDSSQSSFDSFDLVIYDQCAPEEMPECNTLFLGAKPPDEKWKFGELEGPLQIIDLDRSHPMMEFLELASVRIVEGRTVTPPDGGQVLARSDFGPVFSVGSRGPFQDAVLGFELQHATEKGNEINTDWGIKRSFPLFIFACVDYLSGGITQSAATSTLPGQPMTIAASKRYNEFQILTPDNRRDIVQRTENGQAIYTSTETPGIYRVQSVGDAKDLDAFAVNLFSPRESNIAAVSEMVIGSEKVAPTTTTSRGRIEYWRWLLLGGLVLLVTEWVVFNRRVFV